MENSNYNDFIEELISRSIKESRSIDITQWIANNKDIFTRFMHELFNASLHVEEGRQVCIRVALALPNMKTHVEFSKALKFEAKKIVKIAPSINLWDRHLVIKPDSDRELKIFGFLEGNNSMDSRTGISGHSVSFLSIEIHGPGEVRVNAPLSLEYNKGEINNFRKLSSIDSINKWFAELAPKIEEKGTRSVVCKITSTSSATGNYSVTGSYQGDYFVGSVLRNILKYMREGKHGGCIAIVPDKKEIAKNIELNDYKLDSKYLINAIEKRYANFPAFFYLGHYKEDPKIMEQVDLPKDIDDFHYSEKELERAERFIASLSYIDGAVVLSRDLNIIGFGARFTSTLEVESSIQNVGMRHKSAYDFCCKVKDSIAIVVSQDGGITVFSYDGKDSCRQDKFVLDYNRTDI